jgi:hypothetical protein
MVESNELVCKVVQPVAFQTNIDEVVEQIEILASKYMTNPPQSEKEGKEARANLNRIKKVMNAIRIEVKKQALAPYEEIEKKFKLIEKSLNQPIEALAKYINDADGARKIKKIKYIEGAYIMNVPDHLRELIPMETFMRKEWLNVGYKGEDISEEIRERAAQFDAEIKYIQQKVKEKYQKACVFKLACTGNLSDAVVLAAQLEKADEISIQDKAEDVYEPGQDDVEASDEVSGQSAPSAPDVKMYTYRLEVSGTAPAIVWEGLKGLCKNRGLEIKVLKASARRPINDKQQD